MIPSSRWDAWATTACDALQTAYPYASGHVSTGPDDVDVTPHLLHPAFWGCLDWHSSVHMQASLVVLLRQGLSAPVAARVEALLDERLTPSAIAVEVDYLRAHPSFERPYGWAWALTLAAQAAGTRWEQPLGPLVDRIAELVPSWLAQPLPMRTGAHSSTAFAMGLLLTAAEPLGRADLAGVTRERALEWFADDAPARTQDEPGGYDFLSPALTQAALMTGVVPEPAAWLERYLPGLGAGAHENLLTPPLTTDTSDGHVAHLLGLSLSRAWHLRELAPHLPSATATTVLTAAAQMAQAVAPVVTEGHFMSTHWLVTFALFAQLATRAQG